MASPQNVTNSSTPPLNRWRSRLRIFNKPTFWLSTSVLILIGFLLADYVAHLEQTNARNTSGNTSDSEVELEADSSEPSLDNAPPAQSTATLDGIPLPDDPELREWAIREANDLNPEANESLEQSDQSPELSDNDARRLEDFLGNDDPARLIADPADTDADVSETENTDASPSTRNRSISSSLLSPKVNRTDDILSILGLNAQPPNLSVPDLSGGLENPTPNSNTSNLFQNSSEETLPPSALAQALQTLSLSSNTPNPSARSLEGELGDGFAENRFAENGLAENGLITENGLAENGLITGNGLAAPLLAQPAALNASDAPSVQGLTTLQPLSIQTSPPPGTTGYTIPPALPSSAYPSTAPALGSVGTSPLPIAPASGTTGFPSSNGAFSPSPPQPTVTLPQSQTPPPLPTPVFVPNAPVEHTPYTGGGRNGQINTFSNP